jgi:hypothetical protein
MAFTIDVVKGQGGGGIDLTTNAATQLYHGPERKGERYWRKVRRAGGGIVPVPSRRASAVPRSQEPKLAVVLAFLVPMVTKGNPMTSKF